MSEDTPVGTEEQTQTAESAVPKRIGRKQLLIAAGVLVAVAVLVGGALLTAGDGGSAGDLDGDGSPGQTADSGASGAGGGQDATGEAGAPGEAPPGSAGDTAPLSPTERGRATTPAREGSELTTITTPPDRTLAMLDADRLDESATFRIEFRPYGYGPPREGETLVILIDKVVAASDKDSGVDLEGRNMLVTLIPSGSDAVEVGGRYTGEIVFRARGDLLSPFLGGVKAAQ